MNSHHLLPILQKLAYDLAAGTKTPAGLGGPNTSRRTSAHHPIAGAFFVPAVRVMAAVRGTPKGVPVPGIRSANLRTVVTLTCLAASGDDSHNIPGIDTMHRPLLRLKSALSPSVIARAKAHRAMAKHALQSDTSLKTRVERYNHHMQRARALESKGGAQ